MVDGFDTTIPLFLQWFAGMLVMLAIISAAVAMQGDLRRMMLQTWGVLSGSAQRVLLWHPDGRLLHRGACAPVLMRAGPPPADHPVRYRARHADHILIRRAAPPN